MQRCHRAGSATSTAAAAGRVRAAVAGACAWLMLAALWCGGAAAQPASVLVFSRTAGFRHDSIGAGVAMLNDLAAGADLRIDATEDPAAFTPAALAVYAAVVWLNTTGDVLNEAQQAAFRAYIEAGGGYVGIHSAADTEYDWPWYGTLLGGDAWFRSHPAIQTAELMVEEPGHPSTSHLPPRLAVTEEWYNFQRNPRPAVSVLLTLDEATYDPGGDAMGDHPIAWSHAVGAGRAWYTGLGHRSETYADPAFRAHVLGGLLWASGRAPAPTPSPTPPPCAGDCDGDRAVAIDELIVAVGIALGAEPPAACSPADIDGDGHVSIAELVRAVGSALTGCARAAAAAP